jgi:hypothetical protein
MGNDQPGINQGTTGQRQRARSAQQGSDAQIPGQQDATHAQDSLRHGPKGGSEVREDRGIVDETEETDETEHTDVYDEALSRTRNS